MVKLKQLTKAKITIDKIGGYDHREVVQDGAWYDERNLSTDGYPLMTVRRNRVQVEDIDGVSADSIVAITGKERLVWLDRGGMVWCNGYGVQLYPQQAPGENPWWVTSLTPWAHIDNQQVALETLAPQTADLYDHTVEYRMFPASDGTGQLRVTKWYNPRTEVWVEQDLDEATIWIERIMQIGDSIYVRIQQVPDLLRDGRRRTMVSMGAYVYIVPDNLYVNVVRLASGATMVSGTDYGSVDNKVVLTSGVDPNVTITMCDSEGNDRTVDSVGATAPAMPNDGDTWLDTSEEQSVLKKYDGTQWVSIPTTYLKVAGSGIAAGFSEGDAVLLTGPINHNLYGDEVYNLLNGYQYIESLKHSDLDPSLDWIVVPGIIDVDQITVNVTLTVERTAPTMEFVVEQGNRLWGCHYGADATGQILNEIYACKLGDFRNWRVYQGLSTDSYTASRGSDGPYTGAAVLDGHPLFFKRSCVEKVFPSASGAHQIVTQTLDGVQPGSDRSLVVINDKLYYKTDHGIVCYTGAVPQYISAPLGDDTCMEASAARHLQKYVVAMHREKEDPLVYVYDTERGIWHVETEAWYDAPAVTWEDRLYYVDNFGLLMQYDAGDREGVRWYAESGVMGLDVNQRKYISRINLRCRLELGSTATVFVQYNDSGEWIRKGTLWGNRRDTQTLVIWPRRCDTFRLRIEGVGGFRLYSITYLRERGSDV